MTTAAPTGRPGEPGAGEQDPADAAAIGAAVVFATAPAADGGAAAVLPYGDGTVLSRLLEQLAALGASAAHVITRTDFAAEVNAELTGAALDASLHTSAGPAADLALVAELAGSGAGALVIAYGDIVTHQGALAGLLADTRLPTGILAGDSTAGAAWFPVRTSGGRVMSAASPYHWADRANAGFLGVLKVDGGDRQALASAARRLSSLVESPPPGWADERERKRLDPPAAEDVPSLVLTALVRDGVQVGSRYPRELFFTRPLSRESAASAAAEIRGYDEDRILLDAAVKANDGFFTTFFVSPYSRYVARFMARIGRTPNQITTLSMAVGVGSAAAFATGSRLGLVLGAILLQLAFMLDCVDGQLARYTRTFSRFGAWLDSIFDRAKEYLVFAGLAAGSMRGFGVDAWPLAALALTLQTARHSMDFSYHEMKRRVTDAVARLELEEPGDGGAPPPRPGEASPERAVAGAPAEGADRGGLPARMLRASRGLDESSAARWLKRMIVFPIGERFASISLTAALFTPRTSFVVLLAWGGVATLYTLGGRLARSLLR